LGFRERKERKQKHNGEPGQGFLKMFHPNQNKLWGEISTKKFEQ